MRKPPPSFGMIVFLLVIQAASFLFWSWYRQSGATTTVFRLATIEDALTEYAEVHGHFPVCQDARCLSDALPPVCGRKPLVIDGWGRRFVTDVRTTSYLVYSRGVDNRRDPVWRGAVGFDDDDEWWEPEYDVVLRNGDLAQYPWGTLAGWYTPPWKLEIEKERREARGALQLCVKFEAYPAPTVRLYRDGALLAEYDQDGRFGFFAPEGEYQVEVLIDGQEPILETVWIDAEYVTSMMF